MAEQSSQETDKLYTELKAVDHGKKNRDQFIKVTSDVFNSVTNEWTKSTDFQERQFKSDHHNDILPRDSLKHADIIENASALKGIYLTNRSRILDKDRQQLLIVDGDVNFKGPTISSFSEKKKFETRSQYDEFNKHICNYGWGAAVNYTAVFAPNGVQLQFDIHSQNHNDQVSQANYSHDYFSSVTYSIVPVAMWKPDISHLSFSRNAIDELLKIDKLLNLELINDAQNECQILFETFGSHFHMGEVHFGGIHKEEKSSSNTLNAIKTLSQNALQRTKVGGGNIKKGVEASAIISFDSEGTQTRDKRKLTQNVKNKDQISVSTVGGPPEVDEFQVWRNGLTQNNSTWAVIDRGKNDDGYVPVWKIIKAKPNAEFIDYKKLASFLEEKWCLFNGVETQVSMVDNTLIADKEMVDLIVNLSNRLGENKDSTTYTSCMHELLQQVQNINKHLGNSNVWRKQLTQNEKLSDILQMVTFIEFSDRDEIKVRICVAEMLSFEEDLYFPHEDEIRDWLNKVDVDQGGLQFNHDFTSFETFMDGKTFLRFIRMKNKQDKKKNMTYFNRFLTVHFEQAIATFLDIHDNADDNLEYILNIALVVPLGYNIRDKCLSTQITIDQLEVFYQDAMKLIEKYKKVTVVDSTGKQAWILLHMLDKMKQSPNTSDLDIKRLFIRTLKILESKIDTRILKKITQMVDFEVNDITFELSSFMESKTAPYPTLSWNYFTNLSESFYERLSKGSIDSKSTYRTIRPMGAKIPIAITTILEQIGLSTYYPGSISLKDAIAIEDSTFKSRTICSTIGFAILRKMLSNDNRFRDNILTELTYISSSADFLEGLMDDSSDDDDVEPQNDHLHPSDVYLVILMCCDPFLQRLLIHKISLCQLAIPLVYKDYLKGSLRFSLWPFREMCIETNDGQSYSVVTDSLNAITFLRLGNRNTLSKSKLINSYLRNENEEHNTFFHRDCPSGTEKRTISTGMIEVSWYIQVDKTNSSRATVSHRHECSDIESRPVTILNLRGDAYEHTQQVKMLLFVSSVIVLFIAYEDMNNFQEFLSKLHLNDAPVILLIDIPNGEIYQNIRATLKGYVKRTGINRDKTEMILLYSFDKGRKLNTIEIKKDLSKAITKFLNGKFRTPHTLEEWSERFQNDVCTDSETSNCAIGKSDTICILKQIQSITDTPKRQGVILPLQELWRQWSKLFKENNRAGRNQTYDHKETLLCEMKKIRKTQVTRCNQAPDAVARIVEILLGNISNDERIQFFLFWLRQYLDSESKKILPKLRQETKISFERYENMKSSKNKEAVEQAENDTLQSVISLEHVFREIGQIYEAFMYCKECKCNIGEKTMFVLKQLPRAVAKLLLLGCPLEIFDGDASNVPLKWTEAIFTELEQFENRRKVLPISIIGVQSSGKSSMLNTMFGLQFPVSAGKCTRGIFIQLVPIGRDFIMVIDTEGLRAPDMIGATIRRDNELCTLAVGMARVVIVNIKGEAMADMSDILQVTVNGLLRLKQANETLEINRSCVFVHQNVSTQNAKSMNMGGNNTTALYLDKCIEDVASQEHLSHIKSFKDLMEFDSDRDITYVSDLWHGNPPMAPVNTKYIESVFDVAQCILEDIVPQNRQKFCLLQMYSQIKSLWNAIVSDNFVFSFRNCSEKMAYDKLETKFQSLKFELEELKLNLFQDNYSHKFEECSGSNTCIDSCAEEMIKQSTNLINERHKEVEDTLMLFIANSDLDYSMKNWEESKRRCLRSTSECIIKDVTRKVSIERQKFEYTRKSKEARLNLEQDINKRAASLAHRFKEKVPPDEILKKKFEDAWTIWFVAITPQTKMVDLKNKHKIREDLQNAIFEKFENIAYRLQQLVSDMNENFDRPTQRLKYSLNSELSRQFMVNKKSNRRTVENHEVLIDVVNRCFESIEKYFDELFEKYQCYDKSQFNKILNMLQNEFTSNSHNDQSITCAPLTTHVQAMIIVHVMQFSVMKFDKMNIVYDNNYNICTHLLRYKAKAQQLWMDTVTAKTEEIIVANQFCSEIKECMKNKIHSEIPPRMHKKILETFGFRKYYFMKAVMEDVAEKDFENFMRYVRDPEEYASCWLNHYIEKTIFQANKDGNSEYLRWSEEILWELIQDIKKTAMYVTHRNCPETMKEWLQLFCQNIKHKKLIFTPTSFQHLTKRSVIDFENYLYHLTVNLTDLENELVKNFNTMSQLEFCTEQTSPYITIFEALWGCTEKCPWCLEPCQKSANHNSYNSSDRHTCIQHRPQGINGVSWVDGDDLSIDSCTFSVQSAEEKFCNRWCGCRNSECKKKHKSKEYRSYMPTWDIQPCSDMSGSKYWTWHMVRYKTQIEEYYKLKLNLIPESWKDISKEEAMRSLKEYID